MGLRTGSSTGEGGTRARPLRGKVLARPSPSRADDNDCLRIPPTSPPPKSGAGKKESTVRRLNPRCQPSATPSSISSFDQALDGVRTAKSGPARKSGVSKSAKVVLAHRLFRQRREGILKYDLDGMGAAAASRRAAERRVDVADPRTRYSGRDRPST